MREEIERRKKIVLVKGCDHNKSVPECIKGVLCGVLCGHTGGLLRPKNCAKKQTNQEQGTTSMGKFGGISSTIFNKIRRLGESKSKE